MTQSDQPWQPTTGATLLTEKKVFAMPRYETVGGGVIESLRIGYETFGELSAAGDNAILVCHYYSGTSHCAGKYRPSGAAAGYWDSIIGPGKAVDIDRFFVVSSDTLCNLNAYDPDVVTTGPHSIDPQTGKPYGMRFPIIGIRDFVRVQRELVKYLGVKRLYCVMGPSMGALQTIDWAAQFPELVERIISVIGAGLEAQAFLIATLHSWTVPILNDANWRGGDYYGHEPPIAGLRHALRLVTLWTRAPAWAEQIWGRNLATEGGDPLSSWDYRYAVETALDAVVALSSADLPISSIRAPRSPAAKLWQARQSSSLAVRAVTARSIHVSRVVKSWHELIRVRCSSSSGTPLGEEAGRARTASLRRAPEPRRELRPRLFPCRRASARTGAEQRLAFVPP